MRTAYHERLDDMVEQLGKMTRLVASAMSRANNALLDADIEMAEKVITSDVHVDQMREELDAEVVSILALESPVAGELRLVVAVLRISATLERMGDLAVHIAKVARLRYPESAIPAELRGTLLEMGQIAELVVQKAGSALVSRDGSLFEQIERDDDRMDALHRKLFTLILDDSWEHGVEGAIDVTLISRYYERFADHAVSVARRVANDF
ncbi:MAG: phosphate signaling complex protein PhoU [Actinobacteria bacterium]|nr:phosphate signaling complex protein PhoU [Actinomycetota bacterium]